MMVCITNPAGLRRGHPTPVDVIKIDGQEYPIGDTVFTVDDVRIGFEICEDAWRGPLRPGYGHLAHDVDIILCPSASHFTFTKQDIRKMLTLTGSDHFQCVYIYTNLLGNEAGKMIYDGDVMIAQGGRMLAQNKRFSFENIDMLDIYIHLSDPAQSEDRSEALTNPKELLFLQATTLALFDYMRKSYSRGFVLSAFGRGRLVYLCHTGSRNGAAGRGATRC